MLKLARYLLDTSTLIPANKTYYDLAFCPAFWDWLVDASERGTVLSVELVRDQVKIQDPDLSAWLKANMPTFFASLDQGALTLVQEVVNHVNSGVRHTNSAKAAFNSSIYPFLVAYAKAHNCTVVTLERSAGDNQEVVKLPDVCRELNVECIDTFKMLRRERPSFVLE